MTDDPCDTWDFAVCPFCGDTHETTTFWRCHAHAEGDVPCVDRHGHDWTVSDEDENICYCNRCGTMEY